MKALGAAAALALLAPLSACGGDAGVTEEEAAKGDASGTLAAAIGGAKGLSTVSGALSEAGLADVFDGPGSYTVLAPNDDAFAKLGENGKTLTDEAHRAELVALLRGHILPGHMTTDAIKKAIADRKGPVTMTTLGESTVTFSQEGDTISIKGADGSIAKLSGDAVVASNGVVLPLDGLVKKVEIAPAPAA